MKALKLKKPSDKEPVFTEKAAKAYLEFMQGVAEGRKRDAETLIPRLKSAFTSNDV